jgi:hypothetical protein
LHAPAHVVAQHTPCAQTLLAHSAASVHIAPSGFLPHDPDVQVLPALQFASVAHRVEHVLPLHENGTQVSALGATHRPVASQVEGAVYSALSHLSAAQTVPTACLRQAPAPSQRPSVPHVEAAWATQVRRGSAAPAGASEQAPIADASAHVRHAPAHAFSQHTPSTQKPLAQSPPAAQARPLPFLPQLPLWQTLGATQSSSFAQRLMHSPPTQRNGLQSRTPGCRQLPRPSQVPAVVNRSPEQLCGVHKVSAGYSAQPPTPSHSPVRPHDALPWSVHIPRGSTRPSATGQQVPSRPGWLQVRHPPWHAPLQHTPSTQNPDPHWASSRQVAPLGFGPQLPPTHNTPGAQSASLAQASAHAFAPAWQPNGAHNVSAPRRQRPPPSQTWTPVTADPWHTPAPHITPSA